MIRTIMVNHDKTDFSCYWHGSTHKIFSVVDELTGDDLFIKMSPQSKPRHDVYDKVVAFYTINYYTDYIVRRGSHTHGKFEKMPIWFNARRPSKKTMKTLREEYPEQFI